MQSQVILPVQLSARLQALDKEADFTLQKRSSIDIDCETPGLIDMLTPQMS